jgi:hypothetical protein
MDIGHLSEWKTFLDITKSFTTVIAICFGGFWTYYLFIHNHLNYPKLYITITSIKVLLENSKRLIQAQVHIENIGKIVLKPKETELRLRSICPQPK